MPGAATAHALCETLRRAMLHPGREAERREVRDLTRRLVRELRDEGYEPQTVLLQVKEILQRGSLGIPVDEQRLALWKAIVNWTIVEFYRAD